MIFFLLYLNNFSVFIFHWDTKGRCEFLPCIYFDFVGFVFVTIDSMCTADKLNWYLWNSHKTITCCMMYSERFWYICDGVLRCISKRREKFFFLYPSNIKNFSVGGWMFFEKQQQKKRSKLRERRHSSNRININGYTLSWMLKIHERVRRGVHIMGSIVASLLHLRVLFDGTFSHSRPCHTAK